MQCQCWFGPEVNMPLLLRIGHGCSWVFDKATRLHLSGSKAEIMLSLMQLFNLFGDCCNVTCTAKSFLLLGSWNACSRRDYMKGHDCTRFYLLTCNHIGYLATRIDIQFWATENTLARGDNQYGDRTVCVYGCMCDIGRQTLASISAADSVIEALELASHEAHRIQDPNELPHCQPNPLLLGMDPSNFVLKSISSVKASDLEMALMSIPFMDALRLLEYLCQWLEEGAGRIEMICRIAALLVRMHQQQLSTSSSARSTLVRLQCLLRGALKLLKNSMGFNLAGMQHIQATLKKRRGVEPFDQMLPLKQKIKLHE